MKISQLMIITGVLTLLIPVAFYALNGRDNTAEKTAQKPQLDLAKAFIPHGQLK